MRPIPSDHQHLSAVRDAAVASEEQRGAVIEADAPFRGDGEIRALLRSVDWSKTPLGAVASWPKSLISTVHLILEMPTPAVILWGRELTQIYNEGYALIMGPLHPKYFGALSAECWPDTYPAIEPMMLKVLAGGVEKFDEAYFPVVRYGFSEEAYFTFTFSPLRDDKGEIAGLFEPITEVTKIVLAKRRAATLYALSQVPDAAGAVAILSSNAKDVPFAATYLWNDAERCLEVAAASDGLKGQDRAALHAAARQAIDAEACVRIDDFGVALAGPWGDPIRSLFVVPLRLSGRGVVIIGISPNLHFDDPYRRFLESVAASLDVAGDRATLLARESRARIEANLHKERLAFLFMRAPMPVCVLRGPEHVIELANLAICEIWQRPHAEVIERPFFEAVALQAGEVFKDLLDEVLRTGQAYVGREVPALFQAHNAAEPREVYFTFVYEPLRDVNGAATGVFVVAFDVTDEVRARGKMAEMRDTAERENRRKDEFLAMLAHELRNPLAAISNAAHVVKHLTRDNPTVQRPREIIERQLQHLTCLVDDLLDISRLSWGKINLKQKTLSLATVLQHAVEANRPLFDARGQQLTVTLPTLAVHVVGDPTRLVQVFGNLLNNAAKFTAAGGHIALHAAVVAEEAIICVKDNGCGLPETLLPHVFELFTQGGRSLDRAQGGLGVGLALVQSLVKMHGGEVEAHSAGLGQGSEFVIRLPLARNAAEGAHPSKQEATAQTSGIAPRMKVLVVEDNADAAEVLVLILRQEGDEVRLARDGLEALAEVRDFQPQVVLCDIGLPGLSGFEVAARLREQPECRGTLLVALSGYGRDEDRLQSQSVGFDYHLTKPVDVGVLAALIEQRRLI